MQQATTDGKSRLVKVMAWGHQATRHYLKHIQVRSMTPHGTLDHHGLSILVMHYNCPILQIPQCTCPISYNTPYWNRNVHISVPKWCIVGYGTGALWDLWGWSTVVASDYWDQNCTRPSVVIPIYGSSQKDIAIKNFHLPSYIYFRFSHDWWWQIMQAIVCRKDILLSKNRCQREKNFWGKYTCGEK